MSVAELAPSQSPSFEEEEPAEKTMTLMEHLQELRFRLTVSVISIVVGMIPGWFLSGLVIGLL
ncbi:MAG: twin-arginine translocase subunit TatC, partial [Chloroflexota bacterium]|nr:twin-arginine translocase subunit TatC [Chloroflexota bacterium]